MKILEPVKNLILCKPSKEHKKQMSQVRAMQAKLLISRINAKHWKEKKP